MFPLSLEPETREKENLNRISIPKIIHFGLNYLAKSIKLGQKTGQALSAGFRGKGTKFWSHNTSGKHVRLPGSGCGASLKPMNHTSKTSGFKIRIHSHQMKNPN